MQSRVADALGVSAGAHASAAARQRSVINAALEVLLRSVPPGDAGARARERRALATAVWALGKLAGRLGAAADVDEGLRQPLLRALHANAAQFGPADVRWVKGWGIQGLGDKG